MEIRKLYILLSAKPMADIELLKKVDQHHEGLLELAAELKRLERRIDTLRTWCRDLEDMIKRK